MFSFNSDFQDFTIYVITICGCKDKKKSEKKQV